MFSATCSGYRLNNQDRLQINKRYYQQTNHLKCTLPDFCIFPGRSFVISYILVFVNNVYFEPRML